MADAQRTEQPTKRRLDKARKEGKFPASKEMIAAVQFVVFVALMGWWSPELLDRMRDLTRVLLDLAFRPTLTVQTVEGFYRAALEHVFVPILVAGAAIAFIALAAQLGATKLGISLQRL